MNKKDYQVVILTFPDLNLLHIIVLKENCYTNVKVSHIVKLLSITLLDTKENIII